MSRNEILRSIEEGILSPAPGKIRTLFQRLDRKNASPEEALKALVRGMEQARTRFQEKKGHLPDLLLSVDAFREGVRQVRPLLTGRQVSPGRKTIVIGVVEGDVHDMGKNIVAGVLEVGGYAVHDLGRDVKRDAFLEAVEKKRADILALSSMMSTPLENMREVIRWARKIRPDIRVVAGGAALDPALAGKLGADGYAEHAGFVIEEIRRVLGIGKASRRKRSA
jgi:dimethylamine corrinoid protein